MQMFGSASAYLRAQMRAVHVHMFTCVCPCLQLSLLPYALYPREASCHGRAFVAAVKIHPPSVTRQCVYLPHNLSACCLLRDATTTANMQRFKQLLLTPSLRSSDSVTTMLHAARSQQAGYSAASAAAASGSPLIEVREYTIKPEFFKTFMQISTENASLRKELLPFLG